MNALELARSYGVRFLRKPDGGIRYKAAQRPLRTLSLFSRRPSPTSCRILSGREAARAALDAAAPPDCPPQRWVAAQDGLRRFVARRLGRPGGPA